MGLLNMAQGEQPISLPSPDIGMVFPNIKRGGLLGSPVAKGLLGGILDGVARHYGADPGYAMQQAQQRQMDVWRQQQDAELQKALQVAEWKRRNPDPTALQQDAEYLNRVKPGLGDTYLTNRANPIQGVPITNDDGSKGVQFIRPGATGSGDLPTVSDQSSYDAVPDGGRYITPDGHIRTKGGGAGNGTAGFPR